MFHQKRDKTKNKMGEFLKDRGLYRDFQDYIAEQPRGERGKTLMKQFLKKEELYDDFLSWTNTKEP